MSGLKNISRHTIARGVKFCGFELINNKALDMFAVVFDIYMVKTLGSIKNASGHSQRSKTTISDLIRIFGTLDVFSFGSVDLEVEKRIEEGIFYGPISAPVEKFINIYEFMPNFPPLHTFRRTLIKENRVRSRAKDVKERIEQRNQVATNLFRLLKRLGSIPQHADYLS